MYYNRWASKPKYILTFGSGLADYLTRLSKRMMVNTATRFEFCLPEQDIIMD